MIKKRVFLSVVFIAISLLMERGGGMYAQQMAQYSQYRSNYFLLNPAIAGTKLTFDARLGSRLQWDGFEGAPSTSSFSFHSRFNKGKMGLGGYLQQDKIGPFVNNNVNLSYAYHLRFSDVELSMGIAGVLSQLSTDGTQMTLQNIDDSAIDQSLQTKVMKANVATGLYLYNDRFSIGLSGLSFLKAETQAFPVEESDPAHSGVYQYAPHVNFIVGYNYSSYDDFVFENTFYANYVKGAPMVLDYTLLFRYQSLFFVGGSIRLRDAVVGHVGFTFFERLQISYSYDLLVSPLKTYTGGSHEVMLVYSHSLHRSKNRFSNQQYGYFF